jgi:cation diffusion facilitator CzcD-associated flavoprotein CzcO
LNNVLIRLEMRSANQTFDVVIVGAGLSGIGAAYYLKTHCPWLSYTILESREAIGGTWDLFKYPGIRSDSDMYTFGFSFHPWKNPQSIADGPSILAYINETADTYDLRKKIKFGSKVTSASWATEANSWTLTVAKANGEKDSVICSNFLFMCSGYYNYSHGYLPEFPGYDDFKGILVHPQKWDPTLDYSGKEMVIIGSGATAVTLLPELAKKAAKVTMLQRSPTYVMNLPREDKLANFLKKVLPAKLAHGAARWKNILMGLAFYKACRRWPGKLKGFLKKQVQKELGDKYAEQNFNPDYNPWDQRLCFVPDNDLFEAIKQGNAHIITDSIRTFTEKGIELSSGQHLNADIIVTATGLQLQLFGGMKIMIDGKPADFKNSHAYKGVMLSGIPNFAIAIGYTNASWTLKAELNCRFVTRLLNHMKKHGHHVCTPQYDPLIGASEPLMDFNSGYIKRAEDFLPKQGAKAPWKVYQNYIRDIFSLKHPDVKDGYLHYE